MASEVAIEVEDLHKDYGAQRAVRGISFSVRRGEVFGLLGPNGAGKTTTVEILEGFRERTDGRVTVLGFDPAARRQAWDTVRSLQELGKTVLLTTHYLDEAQALADRVAIIKDGAILAEGAPGELGAGTRRYRVAWRDADGTPHARETEDP